MALKSKRLEDVRESVPVTFVAPPEQVRVNLNVSPGMRARWKAAAALKNQSLSDLIVTAVEHYLNESAGSKR